jgi:hypothetical protein
MGSADPVVVIDTLNRRIKVLEDLLDKSKRAFKQECDRSHTLAERIEELEADISDVSYIAVGFLAEVKGEYKRGMLAAADIAKDQSCLGVAELIRATAEREN